MCLVTRTMSSPDYSCNYSGGPSGAGFFLRSAPCPFFHPCLNPCKPLFLLLTSSWALSGRPPSGCPPTFPLPERSAFGFLYFLVSPTEGFLSLRKNFHPLKCPFLCQFLTTASKDPRPPLFSTPLSPVLLLHVSDVGDYMRPGLPTFFPRRFFFPP